MTGLLSLFVENLLPILLIAGLGYVLRRLLRFDPRPVSQVVFYGFAPVFVFQLLVRTPIGLSEVARMVLFSAGLIIGLVLLGWIATRVLRLNESAAAGFLLAVGFMNAGNYGLSATQFAFGDKALAWATLFFLTSAMLTNSLGVYIARRGQTSPLKALAGMARVPSVYAIPLALLVRGRGWQLPMPVDRTFAMLAQATIPTMLVLLGMTIANSASPPRRGALALAVAMRMVLSPAIAWLAVPRFGLEGPARAAAILEAAMPTAVLSTVIASEFRADPAFVTGAVLVSTLLSPLTITPLIALLGG